MAAGAPRWRLLALVALACFAAAFIGIEMTRASGRVAAIWPGNAVLLAVLLCVPRQAWATYLGAGFLANLAANLISGDAAGPAFLLCGANSVEIILAAVLMRERCGTAPDFTESRVLGNFVLISPVVSAVSATLAWLVLGDASVWRTWFLADTLGLLLLTPMLVMIAGRRGDGDGFRMGWECIAVPAAGMAVAAFVFSQDRMPLLFLIFPPLIAAAFRIGVRGAAAVTFLSLAVAFVFTVSGHGPIANNMPDLHARILFLQFYAAVALLTALPVAAVLAQKTRLAASLATSERRFRTLTETAPAGIFRTDRDGGLTYVNPSWCAMTGMSQREAAGDGWLRVLPDDRRESVAQAWQNALLEGWSDLREIQFHRATDGAEIWGASTVAVERDEAGEPVGHVGIVLDITARKVLERELIAARDAAEAAARTKATFLANMSHEIRTPLNGILGFAELLADGDIPPEQARHASFIRESGRELLRLLNDILDLSKIEAGQMTIEQAPFSPGEELRSCAKLLDAAIRTKGLDFDLTIDPALDAPMLGDSLRFRQIVLNLLGNSIKFTEIGSVSIKAQLRGGTISVEVADTGIGISEEQQRRIFHPFIQADQSSTRRFGGTGLGLGISRQLAELMGGGVRLVSQVAVGTTATLRLPWQPAETVEPAPRPVATSFDTGGTQKERRILLVEDLVINRELVCAMLKGAKYSVDTAEDGREAIEMIRRTGLSGVPYDLILMDVQMPVMDGLTATRAIRAMPGPMGTVPIVALTAHAYPAEIQACREAGMDGHIAKPMSASVLLDQIARMLDKGRSRRSAAALDATVASLRPMFEEQKREITARLEAIREGLGSSEDTQSLFGEAAGLAHKIAGFAGTFGEDELGRNARAIEVLLAAPAASSTDRARRAGLESLIRALGSEQPAMTG